MRLITFNVMMTLFFLPGTASAQSQLPNPKEILSRAQSAIQGLKTVSYQAEYYFVGTVKRGKDIAIIPPRLGEVKIARIHGEDPLGARFAVRGERVRSSANASNAPFIVIYDGRKIRKLDEKKQTVYVNEPDQTGMYLLLVADDLILPAFKEAEPLHKELTIPEIRYDGPAVVGGVPCHIVYLLDRSENVETETWWFFGMDDSLPRKRVWRITSLEPGASEKSEGVLTMTDLQVNVPLDPTDLTIEAPEEFEVTTYKGFGKPPPAIQVGDPAPDWSLTDAHGQGINLRDFRGKVVLMDFWATWCGPCLKAMPDLQILHERFKDQGVVMLGVSTWESGDPVRFMQAKGYTYKLLLEGDEVAKVYRIRGIPTLYVVGRDGKILYTEVGWESDSYNKIAQVLREHLKDE